MNFLLNFLAETATAAPTAVADPNATGADLSGAASLLTFLPIVIMIVLLYVIMIVPQRRKDKKLQNLINSAIVGDQIVTIGGLCGKIVNIKDDEITFESSIERSKITIKKWAVKEVKKPIEG